MKRPEAGVMNALPLCRPQTTQSLNDERLGDEPSTNGPSKRHWLGRETDPNRPGVVDDMANQRHDIRNDTWSATHRGHDQTGRLFLA